MPNLARTAPSGLGAAQWVQQLATLRRLALASVIANVVIVVTGGAVRLTGSGLGCPTWPSCTEASLTPTREYAVHGIIEFANRQLTFVLVAVVLATLVVAVLARRQVRLAALVAASIPAQAVLGGITVLTHLNPWTVAAHFLLSMLIIAAAFALWWRLRELPAGLDDGRAADSGHAALSGGRGGSLRVGAWTILALTAAVLAIGTVVTGSGPHAGDEGAATRRIGFDPGSVSQLHADVVMLLIGVSLGFALLTRAAGAPDRLRRAAWLLLAVELAQGLIGYVQYFTHVPAVLVGFHMLGACLVWLAALAVLAHALRRPAAVDAVVRQPLAGQRR
jgi:cytochrome c oxidase assembly protein subunit 15